MMALPSLRRTKFKSVSSSKDEYGNEYSSFCCATAVASARRLRTPPSARVPSPIARMSTTTAVPGPSWRRPLSRYSSRFRGARRVSGLLRIGIERSTVVNAGRTVARRAARSVAKLRGRDRLRASEPRARPVGWRVWLDKLER